MDETERQPRLWNSNYLRTWGANFTLFFSFMLVVPLLPLYLQEEFGASKEMIGFVLSGYTVVALLTRATSGYLVDKYPRKQMLVAGYILLTLFFAGYVAAGSLLLFAAVRTIHGLPFGISTVANSTVAVDVLPQRRRAEGIGYYGLSNNVATAISPTVGLWMYETWHDFSLLFWASMAVSMIGVILVAGIKMPVSDRPVVAGVQPPVPEARGLNRFFLAEAWPQGIAIVTYSFAYGVVSTYVAIYGREELGLTSGSGIFFALLATGLFVSRLFGSLSLRRGLIVRNATVGTCLSCVGYLLFALLHNSWGFYGCAVLVGLGNGHLWPAFQNMFINLGPDSRRGVANASLLTSWDLGVGLGVLSGGSLIERFGYHTAFWGAWVVELLGVLFYLLFVRKHYIQKLTFRHKP